MRRTHFLIFFTQILVRKAVFQALISTICPARCSYKIKKGRLSFLGAAALKVQLPDECWFV